MYKFAATFEIREIENTIAHRSCIAYFPLSLHNFASRHKVRNVGWERLRRSAGELWRNPVVEITYSLIIAWTPGSGYITSKEEQFAGGGGTRGKRMKMSRKW